MLNLKKGLALVLAAATAFTFAPISNLSAPVSAQAATTVTTKVDGEETDSIDVSSDHTPGTVNFTVSGASAGDKLYVNTDDASIATATAKDKNTNTDVTSGGADATTFTDGGEITIVGQKAGDTLVKITSGGQNKNIKVSVLDAMTYSRINEAVSNSKITTANDSSHAKTIGQINVKGTNFSKTLRSNKPTASISANVQKQATDRDGKPRTDSDGKPILTSAADELDVTVSSNPDSVSANRKTATFDVKANTTDDTNPKTVYYVTLAGSVIVGDSSYDIDGTKFTVSIDTAASQGEFTYGGVLNRIYAYKGASYDLAEHASLTYTAEGEKTARQLTPNELRWYLVDNTSATKAAYAGEQRADLKQLSIPTTAGTISQGQYGSLRVTVNDPDEFVTDTANATIVAEADIDGVRTVVYVNRSTLNVTPITEKATIIAKDITDSVQGTGKIDSDEEIGVLNDKIANPTRDNIWLKSSDITYPAYGYTAVSTDTNYDLDVKQASDSNANPFNGSTITLHTSSLAVGDYYETAYIPFQINGSNTVYIQKVNIRVSVNTGVQFRVKDGSLVLASTKGDADLSKDPTVYLNLADKKTFDIFAHIDSDVDKSQVSFSYDVDSSNVTVDAKGVITPVSVGNAIITIKANYKGNTSSAQLRVRVNRYAFDTVTVQGQDGEKARVLDTRDYDNNDETAIGQQTSATTGEYQLVTRQIGYVQIEITGGESTNVVETPVVKSNNSAALTYSFADGVQAIAQTNGLTIDPSTGKITVDYNRCQDGKALGVYAVKVVSAGTSKSEASTNYYYVVVDYPDQTISGLQDNYKVGACSVKPSVTHNDSKAVDMYSESGHTATSFKTVNKTSDDFNGVSYYQNDNTNAFYQTLTARSYNRYDQRYDDGIGTIVKAYSDKQTEHVVAYNAQTVGAGWTFKLITVTSAPAVENKVSKITNKDTGAVIYDAAKDSNETAKHLAINDITNIQVTLEHPVASVASGSAVGLDINYYDKTGKVINQPRYITAVENKNEVDVVLYPNEKGAIVIEIAPTGHLTATDRTDIHKTSTLLAVEYDGKNASNKPAQVKGVKVKNKKGGFVTVTWTKQNQKNIKYYVKKTVGKKSAGKSVNGGKTTLTVKKGAKVKVKVKAYVYDSTGKKLVGKYSKTVTLKTDKK